MIWKKLAESHNEEAERKKEEGKVQRYARRRVNWTSFLFYWRLSFVSVPPHHHRRRPCRRCRRRCIAFHCLFLGALKRIAFFLLLFHYDNDMKYIMPNTITKWFETCKTLVFAFAFVLPVSRRWIVRLCVCVFVKSAYFRSIEKLVVFQCQVVFHCLHMICRKYTFTATVLVQIPFFLSHSSFNCWHRHKHSVRQRGCWGTCPWK